MPKQARKRRHQASSFDIEYQVEEPRNKFKPLTEDMQAEGEELDKIIFGGAFNFLKSLEEAEHEPQQPSCSNVDSGVGEDDSDEQDAEMKELAPAWHDEEDDGIEVGPALDKQHRKLPVGGVNTRTNKYQSLLVHKFNNSVGTPHWAQIKKSHDSDTDEEILHRVGFIKKSSSVTLPANHLEFKKVLDLNHDTYSEGPIVNSVEFHPTSSAALVAGSNGIATLYAVDGNRNNKLHSVSFERFPIYCAKFAQNEAILGSRFPHYFSYDLMSAKATRLHLPTGLTTLKKFVVSPDSSYMAVAGKWGEVHILTTATKERIATLKQDSEVTALTYDPSGSLLYGHGDTGEVTVWDTKQRRVRHKFMDEGCLQGTTLAITPSNKVLAAGSAQGVVNLYQIDTVLSSKSPKPMKSILNLTTSITDLKFNATSELLAFNSEDVPNALKLYHVEAGSVFSNFPTFGSKLGHVCSVNFSPSTGYLAFGNKKSTAFLYRLKHFKNY